MSATRQARYRRRLREKEIAFLQNTIAKLQRKLVRLLNTQLRSTNVE